MPRTELDGILEDFVNSSKPGDNIEIEEKNIYKMLSTLCIRDVLHTWTDREFQLYLTVLQTTGLPKGVSLSQDILDYHKCISTEISKVPPTEPSKEWYEDLIGDRGEQK